MATSDIPKLVAEGCKLDAMIKDAGKRLAAIKGELIKAGAGEHFGSAGERALVIEAGPALTALKAEDLETAKTIAGKDFAKLVEKSVSYKPKKSARELAEALLGKAAAKFVSLIERPGVVQVRFSS